MNEQITLARSLVGKRVRFHHLQDMAARVLRALPDGMIEIEGHGGYFAPHLFKVVDGMPPEPLTSKDVTLLGDLQVWMKLLRDAVGSGNADISRSLQHQGEGLLQRVMRAATAPETDVEPTPDMIRQGIWAWERTERGSTADDVRAIYIAMRRMEGRPLKANAVCTCQGTSHESASSSGYTPNPTCPVHAQNGEPSHG